MSLLLPTLLLLVLLALTTTAIEVTKISSCSSSCGGGGLTFPSDLICTDAAYSTTAAGQKMEACLLCESTSTATNSDMNNDIYWFLFNMKFTAQYCLYDNTTDTPAMPACESVCQPLKPVLESSWLGPKGKPTANQYGYCNLSDGAFGTYVGECATCLQGVRGSVVLGNFLQTMEEGCNTKPRAAQGETIALQRQLFNTSTVAASASTSATPTSTSSLATPTSTSSPTPTSTPPSSGSPSLSNGAAAGIGAGVGVVALAALGGLVWFLLRRRRRAQPTRTVEERVEERVDETKDQPQQYHRSPVQQGQPQQLDGTPLVEADADQSPRQRVELPAS